MAYSTRADIRALDDFADTVVYPDATVDIACIYADEQIDAYCGTAFEPKNFAIDVEGYAPIWYGDRLYPTPGYYSTINLPFTRLRALTSCTIDGAAQDVSSWILTQWGDVRRRDGGGFYGDIIHVAGSYGWDAPPEAIKWASRTIAAQWLKDLHSRIPDRALAVQSDFGQIPLAQAGGLARPTSLPEVNAVLNRYRDRPPTSF